MKKGELVPTEPSEAEATAIDAVRYIERREGEAHARGATLHQTRLIRAQREAIMQNLVTLREIRGSQRWIGVLACAHCDTPYGGGPIAEEVRGVPRGASAFEAVRAELRRIDAALGVPGLRASH